MAQSIVALVPCASYDPEQVYQTVKQGIALIGGISAFVSPQEKILLKPNLLGKALPQKAVTTHPAVFGAVCRLLRESGYDHLSYGDSPGNPTATPEKTAETSGLSAEAARWDVPMADFEDGSMVPFPEGNAAHSFFLANGVQQADALINVCKMKTHALERITGAMKNLYGCILGVNKATGHAKYPNSFIFADMLADLHRCVKPRLHIMDGIEAMEGNGPTSGTPVHMNVLLFSQDPVALDSLFARLVYVAPEDVPPCVSGAKAGLGTLNEAEIEVRTPAGTLTLSQAAEKYGKPDFDVDRKAMKGGFVTRLMPLLPFLQDRPQVDLKRCVACGVCEEACPVAHKAVHSGKGQKARYDYKKCIRCYCCQEMCPAKAITVHHSILNKLYGGK